MDGKAQSPGKLFGHQAAPGVGASDHLVSDRLGLFAVLAATFVRIEHHPVFEDKAVDTVEQGPVMGLGADLDPEKALILALEETLLTFIGMGRYARANPDFTVGDHFKNIVTPTLHALAHAVRPELKNALEFLREPAGTVKFDELVSSVNLSDKNECLDFLVREVERQDLEPLYFNLTTEDIKFAGFQVARVVIPGMQPLDVNHNFRHLGVHRHLEVPEKLELRCQNEINPFPHPFP